MAQVSLNKAHQQNTTALLRRPRPPKKTKFNILHTTTSTKSSPAAASPLSNANNTVNRNPLLSTPTGPGICYQTPVMDTPLTPIIEGMQVHVPYNSHLSYSDAYTEEADDEPSDDRLHEMTNFVVNPLYPKGPPFFPPGKIHKSHLPLLYGIGEGAFEGGVAPLGNGGVAYLDDDMSKPGGNVINAEYSEENCNGENDLDFTLNDFQLSSENSPRKVIYPTDSSEIMISRQNYLKLTGWFSTNIPKQDTLNTVNLEVDHDAPGGRVPRRQALIELQAMVDRVLEESGCCSSTSLDGTNTNSNESDSKSVETRWPTPTSDDIIFRSSTSRYFCGQGRSDSPFDATHQPLISPSEVAILECMMNGGTTLSLKAHFITELPLLSPLARTLTSLNLSFNDLRVFPMEVCELHNLRCLRMRNNPIKEVPNEIRNLRKLRVFCISFSLLSDLPTGLFDLSSLVDLDVSYNSLHLLPRDLGKLKTLRKLNVEGNRLPGLPCTALSLPLTHLLVGDNLMHPVLWKENTRNQPQALVDLICVVVSRSVEKTDDPRLPQQVVETLQSVSHDLCDNCGCTMYGSGLRLIRGVNHKRYSKYLPFLFNVCSPKCRTALKKQSHSNISKH